ncbi:Type I secretion system membrane fusion protein PrsE [Thiorhodovibrio winogradskyi]|uniref:Membrane fusion protein (MFP) family protein n=1 Tax=Thiorhodovibrio winogradskyi TaxID=77007 RepID=A0ABZ0SCC9_9GAMM|nr:HlyD family type I secretion periplasmic adaptor subunit [Thiorhodovibrio winogradskyi]
MTKMLTTESRLPRAPETLTDDRGIRRFGYLLVFVLLFGVVGWAGSARIDGAAVAPGVVTVESYRQAVQHLEGGIIRKLLVREGDMVLAGQPVAQLDDTQFASQLDGVRSELGAYLAIEARLKAERDGADTIEFPAKLLAQAQRDPRLPALMDSERAVFVERTKDLKSQLKVLAQSILSLRREIEGLEEREALLSRRADLFQDELDGLRSLFAEGLGDKVRVRELERELIGVQSDLSQTRTQHTQSHLRIKETQLEMEKIQQSYRTEIASQLSEVRQRILEAQEKERRLADQVDRTMITAPVSGRVVGLEVHTVGAVLAPGAKLMEVVPELEQLVIDAEVSPDDIDKVHPGLDADVRFSALNFRTTPVVHGRVETVSADRLESRSGDPYFLARISIPEEQRLLLGKQPILPGMSAQVFIITGERTALQYVMQPLTDALASSMRED